QAVAFINQSEFWANQARNHGGAIYHSAQRLNVDSSRFESNESHVHGGAIYWDGFAQAILDIKRTTLLNNRALQGKGGAINMQRAGLLELAESTFDRNQAAMEGGGIAAYGDGGTIYWGGFSANLENNTFSQNQSLGNTGGAIDIKGGALWDILHNTFSLNSANDGGAISYGVNLTKLQQINLDHSLIAGNTASGAGVDVFFAGGAGTILSLGSNLIGIIDASGITPSASDLSGTLSSPLAALLGPLANNGGLTWTHLPLAGSPAIDGGTATPLLFDQRGVPRSGAFDIGAVERVSGAPRISVSVSSGVKLWPNPSQGSFQIRLAETYEQPVQIKIFNNAGQLIHTTSLAAGQNELKLNVLRDQPSGIYLVEISGPLERESLRIVRD
ncbi:MAG: choice-of-anchor Q domain-containing protein, partial [Bacteroidota bacterium]